MTKLDGFPSVQVINLEESVDRKKYMVDQFTKYGINYKIHTKPRYVTFKDKISVEVVSPTKHLPNLQIGAITSFLDAMKDWYYNTEEYYAIFCEDDISFESIEYWNFCWRDFMWKIPPSVDCVQLIRIPNNLTPVQMPDLELKLKPGRWWGATFMANRAYIKNLLDILHPEDGKYILSCQNGWWEPCIENCFFLNYNCSVYNFPLLFENNFTLDPVEGRQITLDETKLLSNYIVRHYWRTLGKDLDLTEAMRI